MKFTKMHGLGNDYIYINCFEEAVCDPGALSKKLSDRHFGIGADGLVLIKPSKAADFSMEMYNADGSRGETCGNALRCVAKYVCEHALTDKTRFSIETLAGISDIELHIIDGKVEKVTVNMGRPEFSPKKIPVNADGDNVFDITFNVNGRDYEGVCLSMGNPHCVVFVEDVDALNLNKLGPAFENNEIFPNRVNTEFVEVIDKNTIKMRVWERGSGETLACGSGACAALVAGAIRGKTARDAKVILLGGILNIKWDDEGYVKMTGPCEEVFMGDIDI